LASKSGGFGDNPVKGFGARREEVELAIIPFHPDEALGALGQGIEITPHCGDTQHQPGLREGFKGAEECFAVGVADPVVCEEFLELVDDDEKLDSATRLPRESLENGVEA